jgi:hypothetical protein
MTTKKKFSESSPNKKRTFFEDMETLMAFSKSNINSMTENEIEKTIENLAHVFIAGNSKTPFQDFAKTHYRYMELLGSDSGLQKVKSALTYNQSCLLEKMTEAKVFIENPASGNEFSFSGTVVLTFDPETAKYFETYVPEGFKSTLEIDPEIEGKLIEAKYFEIVTYLIQELPAGRFKVCEKCNTPFFQATAREKLYCSTQCSRAVAQAHYIKRKIEGGDHIKK